MTYPRSPFIGPLLPNTKMIPLTQDQYALVDEEDYEDLNQFNWCAMFTSNTKSYRAVHGVWDEKGKRHLELMHRRVTGFQWEKVDHINHKTLDNRKSNLRDGTLHNAKNRLPSIGGTSIYHGVCWFKTHQKWAAKIHVDGVSKYLGFFDDELEAAKAYNAASLLYHGEYGTRNQLP